MKIISIMSMPGHCTQGYSVFGKGLQIKPKMS
jgi:hypothetical protein